MGAAGPGPARRPLLLRACSLSLPSRVRGRVERWPAPSPLGWGAGVLRELPERPACLVSRSARRERPRSGLGWGLGVSQ